MITEIIVAIEGERRWRRYRLSDQEHKGHEAGSFHESACSCSNEAVQHDDL